MTSFATSTFIQYWKETSNFLGTFYNMLWEIKKVGSWTQIQLTIKKITGAFLLINFQDFPILKIRFLLLERNIHN